MSTSSFSWSTLGLASTSEVVHAHAKDLDHLDLIQACIELADEVSEEVVVNLSLGLASVQEFHDEVREFVP